MAYDSDMEQAANRHYRDGKKLQDSNCIDNAGYHYGFAAECAIKHRLLKAGVREDDTAMWLHFHELRTYALLAIARRTDKDLYDLINQSNFMQEWGIRMRYAKNGSVLQSRAEKWRKDADQALGLLI